MTPQAQQIQALLFVAGEAVSKEELAKLIKEPIENVAQYIQEIETALSGHGLAITNSETHVQLTTAPAVSEYLSAWQQEELGPLTKAAAETLAIIAYRGPIARYEVDMLRGVDCRSILRQLIRRGIVRPVRRSGRTPLYDVTEDFLLNLGITKREELPDFATLQSDATVLRILDSSSSSESS